MAFWGRAVAEALLSVKGLRKHYGGLAVTNNVSLDVQPGEGPARVVINAKTGTVVISRNVRVTASAVAHARFR